MRAQIEPTFWAGRRVFLTGHTGFKGAWLSLLLGRLGAMVTGYALPPNSEDDLFELAGIDADLRHREGDIRDLDGLSTALAGARPDIVIHMAAQALVRRSYNAPVETYATNVMGTVNVLEASRRAGGVTAIVVVTSDKCNDNREWVWGYREDEPLGGRDPYSNSKGCAELVTAAYRDSFLAADGCRVATARAGNVVGGGDWSEDRLVPDAVRAFRRSLPLRIRHPKAVRPWQHVLEPVSAYLLLAQALAGPHGEDAANSWNFGPGADSEIEVGAVAGCLAALWGPEAAWEADAGPHPHEATFLKLDCAKARRQLGWWPVTDVEDALRLSVAWYRAHRDGSDMRSFTLGQVDAFLERRRA